MKILSDFFPIILFFIAYKFYGIYTATVVAIVATVVQVAVLWLIHRRVEKMHLISLAIIVVFGGATLLLHDETYIKWKPTVVNWLFAAVFLGSQFIGGKSIIERMLGHAIALPAAVWRNLNLAWVGFFVATGALNLYVAYHFDTDTWVDFKLFGILGLTLVFVIAQGLFLSRYASAQEQTQKD
ncbi:MAG: septation protein A [Pseudomonadota bacterium]